MTDVDAIERVVQGDVAPEIVRLEARIRAAQLGADVDELDALISEDLLFTGPSGQLDTKAADLASHRTGAVRFRRHDPIELRARRVGADVVVTTLSADLEVEVGDVVSTGRYRYTRVWARDGDDRTWQVVAGHVSEVMAGT